jgi:hypothetical protein
VPTAGALIMHEGENVPVLLAARRGSGEVHGNEARLTAEAALILILLELGELHEPSDLGLHAACA